MSALPRFFRHRFVRLLQGHRPPRSLDNGPYSRSLCGLGGVEPREDSPFFVDEGCLGPAKGMRAVQAKVKADHGQPLS